MVRSDDTFLLLKPEFRQSVQLPADAYAAILQSNWDFPLLGPGQLISCLGSSGAMYCIGSDHQPHLVSVDQCSKYFAGVAVVSIEPKYFDLLQIGKDYSG